ncbi:MAG: HAD family hydrolase [Holdemania massiliensis]
MKAYTHLVFDIDGTLLNTEMAVLHSLQWALQHNNRAVSGAASVCSTSRQGADPLSADRRSGAAGMGREICGFLREITILKELFAAQALRARGIHLGVVTSKTQVELAQDFDAMGLTDYFDIIVTADDTVQHKPDAEPMLNYLKRSGAKAAETIYIGDADYDLQCALRAGCDCALAQWGRTDLPATAPTWILHQVSDVWKLPGLKSGDADRYLFRNRAN